MPSGSDLSSPFPLRALNHTVGVGCKGQEGTWEGQSLNKILSSGMLCVRKWYSAQPFRSKSPREGTGPFNRPPTGAQGGYLLASHGGQGGWAGVRARERMVLGLGLHSEMGWADTAEGPVGQTSQLDPASLPSLWGCGSQLDPVGLQDPGGASLPPSTHFVKPPTPPQVLQGLWGPRLGRDVERSLGWGLVRKGTLKTQNRKKTNGKTCSPPQTEAGV